MNEFELGYNEAKTDYDDGWVEDSFSELALREYLANVVDVSEEYLDGYISGLKESGYIFNENWGEK